MPSGNSYDYEDFKDYEEDFVKLVEMIYGKGFLSQGGEETVDKMFLGIDLDHLKVLDIGSGLGSPDFHLAKKFNVDIVGIDPQKHLIDEASRYVKEIQKELRGHVKFIHMLDPSSLSMFESNSFDVVFSKESLLHVPDEIKEILFDEMHRVLKPQGKLILMDWMHETPDYSEGTKKMMAMDHMVFHLMTPEEYKYFLKKKKFHKVHYQDITERYVELTKQNIKTIKSLKSEISQRFSKDMYDYSLLTWGLQQEAFEKRDFIPGILSAVCDK